MDNRTLTLTNIDFEYVSEHQSTLSWARAISSLIRKTPTDVQPHRICLSQEQEQLVQESFVQDLRNHQSIAAGSTTPPVFADLVTICRDEYLILIEHERALNKVVKRLVNRGRDPDQIQSLAHRQANSWKTRNDP